MARSACRVVRMSLNWISCRVERTARRLDVVLQHLAAGSLALVAARAWRRAQMRRATRPMTEYSGSMSVGEEEGQIGRERRRSFMPRDQVVLHDGEAIGQREGELA